MNPPIWKSLLKLRTGLIFTALALIGCDHHKPADQAQAEAGNAAVAKTPPRALPVSDVTVADQPPISETNSIINAQPATDNAAAPSTSKPADAAPATPSIPSPPAQATAASTPAPGNDTAALPQATNAPTPIAVANPAPTADTAQQQVVVLKTSLGIVVIELDDFAAPKTCENFRKLVSAGVYDHTTFHRVIPNFIIQGGDPNSQSGDRDTYGLGGPGYTLPPEIKLKHDRGAVAMARLPDTVNRQRESNGSQFYICVIPCPSLDNQYTVFGHVIKGMDVVTNISFLEHDKRDNPINRFEMEASLEPKEKALADNSTAKP